MEKKKSALWQITLPLTVIAIFSIGSLTIIKMKHGNYSFEVRIPGWLELITKISKDIPEDVKDIQ